MKLKNKKGFTLVELLAVIVILSVVALITVPVVTDMISSSKRKSFESSAYGLVESAKVYYSGKTEDIDFEGKVFKFGEKEDISGLNIKGKKPVDGEVIVNTEGEIKISVTDGEYCAFKSFESNDITITEGKGCVIESETPIINLVANKVTTNRISLVAECSYEKGNEIKIEKYEFSKDGGKTWNSTLEKNYYTYSNLEQKEYTFVARCVTTSGTSTQKQIVISPSQIDEVIINVPEGWAREKEVTISYPKGRYKYQYQELNSINDTITEDKWITVEETESGSTHNVFKKTYTENKYIVVRVLDSVGNYVDSDSYAIQKIDRTPPACGSWTGNSTWTNKSVTVKVACNETQDENNNISGCTASSYNVKTYSTTTKTASLSYTIEDNAGNTKECSNSSINVYVDTDKPTCTFSGESTSWRASGTVTATCADTGGSNCTTATASKSWAYTSGTATTKTASLSYTIEDNAGNTKECSNSSANVYVDRTAPSIPTVTNSSGGSWTNANVTLSASSTDTGSGINKIEYSYNNSSWATNWGNSYTSITNGKSIKGVWSTATNSTVYIRACDAVGNCSASTTTAVKIDKTAPSTPSLSNSSGGSWTNANVTITASSTDTGGSGINKIEYSYNNSSWATDWGQSYVAITNGKKITGSWSAERNNTVYIRACDAAGNCSANATTAVKIDKTAPSTPSLSNSSGGSWTTGPVTITASSTDTGSGINKIEYSYNNSSWATDWGQSYVAITNGKKITGSWSAKRNNTVYIRACDAVGNCSASATTAVKIGEYSQSSACGTESYTYSCCTSYSYVGTTYASPTGCSSGTSVSPSYCGGSVAQCCQVCKSNGTCTGTRNATCWHT